MELKEAIEKRASVRHFTNEPVPVDDLKEIVRLAGLAPSINNSQPWKFVIITKKALLKEMADKVSKKIDEDFKDEDDTEKIKSAVEKFSTFFAESPALIAVLSRNYEAVADKMLGDSSYTHEDLNKIRNHPDIQSIGAAIQNILLAAVDKGYGACWLSGLMIAKEDIEKLLNVSEPFGLAACVAIGKPGENVKQREKKPLDEILDVIE